MFSKSLDFSNDFIHVVNWNAIARNCKHDFKKQTIDNQLIFVKEEMTEMIEDGIAKEDKVMYLDGLCDMFVTGAYWYFLQNEGKPKNFSLDLATLGSLESIDWVTAVKHDFSQDSSFMFLQSTCVLLYKFNGNSEAALKEVLASNDSKFPYAKTINGFKVYIDRNGNEVDPEVECRQIELRFKGKHTGVHYEIVKDFEKKERFIFWNDKSKVVKPSSFFEPNLKQFC